MGTPEPFVLARSKARNPQMRFLSYGIFWILVFSSLLAAYTVFTLGNGHRVSRAQHFPADQQEILRRCAGLKETPGPPADFYERLESDRFVPGTKPVIIRNATIWTGVDGEEGGIDVVHGDILLDKGIIQAVGSLPSSFRFSALKAVEYDAHGAWVTPGLVDMHSHHGLNSAPPLSGAGDTNSRKGPVLPWLRSLDGFNTHDAAYELSRAGGVTTSLILPGSANAIGGQAFVIKLRHTEERSTNSLLLEPPFELPLVNNRRGERPLRWRHMKQACGENPNGVYSSVRMDIIWAFRQAYQTANEIKLSQDRFCAQAEAGQWEGLGAFPENYQWEALVDVLRGRVKIHNHCYEAVDFNGIINLTNEFNFSIAAFHHAHEAYLIPDLLKQAFGGPPAIAMFATHANYKREAFRGSEFAPVLLAAAGIPVVMKSDHPVLNSRHLIFEAQQAHYHGLSERDSLRSVFGTPADIMGLDHRVGYLKEGYDADIVIWDSHPLQLGATPTQVFIDGIPQLSKPHRISPKPASLQRAPRTPDFVAEARLAVELDGTPPLGPVEEETRSVRFRNVRSVFVKKGGKVKKVFDGGDEFGDVIVEDGKIKCVGTVCDRDSSTFRKHRDVDLHGGSISPGVVSYGSFLGLGEIEEEDSTLDGPAPDPLVGNPPSVMGGDGTIIKAQDGLIFRTRNALNAYRTGVTTAIAVPSSRFLAGVSTYFSTGASTSLDSGAVLQDTVAVHVNLRRGSNVSISTQIEALRNLLLGRGTGERSKAFESVTKGKAVLVITTHSANTMANVLRLKREVEAETGKTIRLTFAGALEAHLIAKELGQAGVGVILNPARPFPRPWDAMNILPGPPLTADPAWTVLLKNNVTVGLGVPEPDMSRLIRFYTSWAGLESPDELSESEAIALTSVNMERLLGVAEDRASQDLVATAYGSVLGFEGKVVAVVGGVDGVTRFF